MHSRSFIIFFALLISFCSCADAKVTDYGVKVIKEYPHDVEAYTQGLFFHDGNFYESTGQNGRSSFRKVDLKTGKPIEMFGINKKYFGEGSVIFEDNLYILTWESKVAFIYDAKTLKYKSTVSYPRQGWGLTTDGKELIASDGSSTLYYMDKNMTVTKRVTVKLEGRPIRMLNELEYIDGKIWANVYMTDLILIINPSTGNVEATIDCTGLLAAKYHKPETDVLNGIAYNPKTKAIYLTGKNWPLLFQIELVERK
jgi:glutamine cyclotransferase